MTRPKKLRKINAPPRAWLFKPQGIPARFLEELVLDLDECEALRLVDLEGMTHEEAADVMGISRPTLTRLLESARRKLAEAIFKGKAIVVDGPGPQTVLNNSRFVCLDCFDSWIGESGPRACPKCGSSNVVDWMEARGFGGRFRWGRR